MCRFRCLKLSLTAAHSFRFPKAKIRVPQLYCGVNGAVDAWLEIKCECSLNEGQRFAVCRLLDHESSTLSALVERLRDENVLDIQRYPMPTSIVVTRDRNC